MSETNATSQTNPPPGRRAIPVLYQGHARLTWTLLGVILVIFILEEILGGSELGPVLKRLGANLPAQPFSGNYWRLITSIFLHIGPVHLLANGLVLVLLGRFFEKLVGSRRFFLLFIFSGAAGSWASVVFSKADLSAGASGALWGLLGACLALSLFPGPVFPTPWVKSFRKNTIFNLAINFYFSTWANIDFAAHLGGGIMGLLLFASGFLTRGLPVQPHYPVPRFIQLSLSRLFFLCVLVTCVSLLIPWAQKKPQELWGPGELQMQAFDLNSEKNPNPFQLTMDTPHFLSVEKKDVPLPGALRFTMGDIRSDPLMVILTWIPLAETLHNTAEKQQAAEEIRAERQKQSLPENAEVTAGFSWLSDVPSPSWSRTLNWNNGLLQNNLSQIQSNALVDIQILYYDAFKDNYEKIGPTLLRSLELRPNPQQP